MLHTSLSSTFKLWIRTLKIAKSLPPSPPPPLPNEGHASCCASRSFLLLLYAWGEPYLVSGERCRPFRAHVVIATDLVGAAKKRSIIPRLDIECSFFGNTFLWSCTWSCALIVIGVRFGRLSAIQGLPN